jgi:archaemetzincin
VNKISLIILSEIDPHFVSVLCRSLEKTFNRPVEIRYMIASLEYARDAARTQYKSPLILARLRRMKKSPREKIMAVVDVDLYSPGYDFIYGEADVHAGVATLSTNRLVFDLKETRSNLRINDERIIREATHEMGHLFGLVHCRNPKCVMRTCTCLSEVDEAVGGLCPVCYKKLQPNL